MFTPIYTEDDVQKLEEALETLEKNKELSDLIDKPEILERALCEAFPEVGMEMKKLRRNAIYFDEDESQNNNIPIGASKVGGFPDLPPDVEFPTITGYTYRKDNGEIEIRDEIPMHLVFQINLSELSESGADIDNLFPKTGMLYLFWSGEMFEDFFKPNSQWNVKVDDPTKTAIHKIFWWDGDFSKLRRTVPALPYPDDDIFDDECTEYRIMFSNGNEYNHHECCDINGFNDLTENIEVEKALCKDKLLGVPDGANTPVFEKDDVQLCQLVYRVNDVWELYWIMKKDDLLNLNFENVRLEADWD
ncbi:MAG: DUF1963 domain-containing protein [Oscillospiraceae bacterium]|nr:DUF1963 domain-containing protein [Oscillospiraceae bacterium]MBR3537116.1 DUF1963 domain-containing protein [Oscillospiraceae bacterium]